MVHQPQRRATADNLFLHRLQQVTQMIFRVNTTADVQSPCHNYVCVNMCAHTCELYTTGYVVRVCDCND